MKFCRRFERFAASLVRCLSVASYARKASESATVQNGEHKFLVWILYIIISFFSYTQTAIQITTSVYVIRYWLVFFIIYRKTSVGQSHKIKIFYNQKQGLLHRSSYYPSDPAQSSKPHQISGNAQSP